MPDSDCDLAVIGGGSAGLTASIMAARLGARVVLIERAKLGGDCLHTGCVPSKTLIASARAAHRARTASALGIETGPVSADLPAVMERVRAVQAAIAVHDSVEALRGHGVEVVSGTARFLDHERVEIVDRDLDRRRLTPRRTIIATGASPQMPAVDGLAASAPLDHESVWSLGALPSRLVVIGAGPIGCELGQAFARLGSRVTILERAQRILPSFCSEAAAVVARAFETEGIRTLVGCDVRRVERDTAKRRAHVELPSGSETLEADAILVATGRRPNVDGLGLDRAGIEYGDDGIEVDASLRTTNSRVFAAGDCAGGPQSTHWAEREARVATRNALYVGAERVDRDYAPRVVFTDPELAQVGPSVEVLQATEVEELRWPMDRVDRALCEGRADGFASLFVDRRDRIRRGVAVGELAGELVASWMIAIEHGLTMRDIGSAVHPYPTFSRANRRLADEAFLRRGPPSWASLFARFHGG